MRAMGAGRQLDTRSPCHSRTVLLTVAHAGPAGGFGCQFGGSLISTIIDGAPDLSTLVAAMQAADLTDVLFTIGPINVFAPTNEAFGKMLSAFGVSEEALLAETAFLANALQYHVVADGAVCEGDLSGVIPTAQGASLTVDGSTVTDANGGVAEILGAIEFANGVVYVIDTVLLPPSR